MGLAPAVREVELERAAKQEDCIADPGGLQRQVGVGEDYMLLLAAL